MGNVKAFEYLQELIELTTEQDFIQPFTDEYLKDMKFGDFLITGMTHDNFKRKIGYVVQIRREAGAYRSDMVLLRHQDGELVPHHNQSFTKITDEYHIKLLREQFNESPEGEIEYAKEHGHTGLYTIQGKQAATGFVIEAKD